MAQFTSEWHSFTSGWPNSIEAEPIMSQLLEGGFSRRPTAVPRMASFTQDGPFTQDGTVLPEWPLLTRVALFYQNGRY